MNSVLCLTVGTFIYCGNTVYQTLPTSNPEYIAPQATLPTRLDAQTCAFLKLPGMIEGDFMKRYVRSACE